MGIKRIFQLILIAMLIPGYCKISAQYNKEMLFNVRSGYEKVYVQLDRRVYVTGENVRYRAFLVDASLNKPVNGSRVLYLELSGLPGDKPAQWRISLHRGAASGTFPIPADLESGVYRLRAYTNWMRNGDPAYVFSNELMIINISEEESGTIFLRNDSLAGVDFPEIESTGYQVRIEKNPQGIAATILSPDPGTGVDTQLQLLALSRGNIILDTMINSLSNRDILIQAAKLNQGIISFTLLDTKGSAISQRLYFNENKKDHLLQVTGLKEQYRQNENIGFDLSMVGLGINDTASLAVTIREVDPFNKLLAQPSIDRYFNILSEIRDIDLRTALINDLPSAKIQELLMITDANDYAWNYINISSQNACLYQKENHGYILKGKVTGSLGKPVADANLLLCVRDSISPRPIYIKTDAEGRFYAVLNAFYDNKEILLQVIDNQNNSDLTWEIERANLPVPDLNTLPYNFTPDEITYVDRSKNIRIIEEIYKLHQPAIIDDHLPTIRNSFIAPDYVIYPADFTELVNFKEIADNILPTAHFITRNNQYNTEVFNRYLGKWFENSMILLNGVLFKDLSYIATLGSRDIRKIELYNSNILCGDYTFPGLIAVYTRDGKIPETYIKSNTYSFVNSVIANDVAEIKVERDAGQPVREFPDFRQTLYWNPDIRFSGTEHVKVEFESSRLQGEFEIIIQGMTNGGEAISETFKFSVE
jgi:hypothetical protein